MEPDWFKALDKPSRFSIPNCLCMLGERRFASTMQSDPGFCAARVSAEFMQTQVQPSPDPTEENTTTRGCSGELRKTCCTSLRTSSLAATGITLRWPFDAGP